MLSTFQSEANLVLNIPCGGNLGRSLGNNFTLSLINVSMPNERRGYDLSLTTKV